MNFKQRAMNLYIETARAGLPEQVLESDLRSAYQEGLEDAAKVAEDREQWMTNHSKTFVSDAIRQLKESSNEK